MLVGCPGRSGPSISRRPARRSRLLGKGRERKRKGDREALYAFLSARRFVCNNLCGKTAWEMTAGSLCNLNLQQFTSGTLWEMVDRRYIYEDCERDLRMGYERRELCNTHGTALSLSYLLALPRKNTECDQTKLNIQATLTLDDRFETTKLFRNLFDL